MIRSRPHRTVAAVAAVAAVVGALAGGGIALHASADDATTAASFVPITPCRLLDTRPLPDNVGARKQPLGAGETMSVTVWGSSGHCQIPAGATALSMNVVAVNPTSNSYLTVFPSGTDRPLASSLNWVGGQAPTPNAVTSAVSTSLMGALSFYNNAGSVDLAVDIVGYYRPADIGAAGPAGPVGPAGPTGPAGGPAPANVLWVAASGAPYTKVSQALAAITGNDVNHRYTVMVAPGTYTETATLVMKDYVDIQGSGRGVTTITCLCSGTPDNATLEAVGNLHTEVRNLTVTNNGGSGLTAIGVFLSGAPSTVSIIDTGITATESPTDAAYALYAQQVNQPRLDGLDLYVAGAGSNTAIFVNFSGGSMVIRNSRIYSTQVAAFVGSSVLRLAASTVNGTTTGLINRCDLVVDVNGAPYTCM